MSQEKHDLRNAVGEVFGEDRSRDHHHPSIETWRLYLQGDLQEEAAQRLQDHLVSCPACTDLVVSLEAFLAEPEAGDAETAEGGIEPFYRERRQRPAWTAPVRWLAAASLVLAAVALGWSLPRVETGARSVEPDVNVAVIDLDGGDQRAKGDCCDARAGEALTLLFHGVDGTHSEYRADIVGPRGRRLWSASGLVRDPTSHALSWHVRSGVLSPGDHTVLIKGLTADGQWEEVESAVLAVGDPPP